MRFDEVGAGHQVFGAFRAIERAEEFHRRFFFTRVAAQRCQCVGGKGDVVFKREATGDIFDVRVESAVFMDDHDCRQFAACFGRTHEVTLDCAGTLRRRVADIFGFDARVVFRDLLRHRVIRAQGFEHCRRGKSADGVFGCTVEKFATIEHAMHVAVE